MPYKVSFLVNDEEYAKVFVQDTKNCDNVVSFNMDDGSMVEFKVSEVYYEEVSK